MFEYDLLMMQQELLADVAFRFRSGEFFICNSFTSDEGEYIFEVHHTSFPAANESYFHITQGSASCWKNSISRLVFSLEDYYQFRSADRISADLIIALYTSEAVLQALQDIQHLAEREMRRPLTRQKYQDWLTLE